MLKKFFIASLEAPKGETFIDSLGQEIKYEYNLYSEFKRLAIKSIEKHLGEPRDIEEALGIAKLSLPKVKKILDIDIVNVIDKHRLFKIQNFCKDYGLEYKLLSDNKIEVCGYTFNKKNGSSYKVYRGTELYRYTMNTAEVKEFLLEQKMPKSKPK